MYKHPKQKKIIVGLGNPEKKYQNTRHNLGFMTIDQLINKLDVNKQSSPSKKYQASAYKINYELSKSIEQLICVKPLTYMNHSGTAVTQIVNFYKTNPEDLWVIHDDIDLPLGKIRIREGGSSAGHNGVQSLIDHLGTANFVRFRLGIGPVPINFDPANFVLANFLADEMREVKQMIEQAVEAVIYAIKNTVQDSIEQYN